jgi:hypothetical protein
MGRRRRLLTALKLGAAGGAVLGTVAGVRRVLAAPPAPPVYPTGPSIYHLVGAASTVPDLSPLSEIGTVEASFSDGTTYVTWVRLRTDRDLETVRQKWFFCSANWRPDIPHVGRISPAKHGQTLPYADPRIQFFRAYQAGPKGDTIPQDWFVFGALNDVPGYDESAFSIFRGIAPGFLEQQDVGSAGTFRTIAFPEVTTLKGAYISPIAEFLGEAGARTSWFLYLLPGYVGGWGQEFTLTGDWQVQSWEVPVEEEWAVSGVEIETGRVVFSPFSIRNCVVIIPVAALPDAIVQQALGYVSGCQWGPNPSAFYVGPAPSRPAGRLPW